MRITLPSGTDAEIAEPESGSPRMGLVIAPDIFGLRPLYDDMVRSLADGWDMTVCAVEPFPGRDLGPEIDPRFAAVADLDDFAHLRDLEDAADAIGLDNVGLLGYCMGGMYCFKSAGSSRFSRIVSFYGMIRLPDAWHSSTQGEPLEALQRGDAQRVMAIIGDKDHYTPPEDVEALADTGVVIIRYPDAEHGFAHDPSRPAHRAGDAADAYLRAHNWLTIVDG
jgi:dienelactone hydrolase